MKKHNLIDPDMFETGSYKEDHFWDSPSWFEIAATVFLVGLGVVGIWSLV